MSSIKSAEEGVNFALEVVRGYNDGTGEFKKIGSVLMIVEQALQLAQVKFNSLTIHEALQDPEVLEQLDLGEMKSILGKVTKK